MQNQLDIRANKMETERLEQLLRKFKLEQEDRVFDKNDKRPMLPAHLEKKLDELAIMVKKQAEPAMIMGGGDAGPKNSPSGIQVINAGGSKCYFQEDDEECICPPVKVKFKDMSASAKLTLKTLAEQKAIACSKIDLLKCLGLECDQQTKMWAKFRTNCEGDYLSKFTAQQVQAMTCGKNAVFNGPDLHTMKAVAQCLNLSQNLCKSHKDSQARFRDKKALGPDYTLGGICYEELKTNVRRFGDKWSRTALKNRQKDPIAKRLMICEDPVRGVTKVTAVPTDPQQIPDTGVQLQPAVAPAVGGYSSGGYSGGGGGYSGGGGGGGYIGGGGGGGGQIPVAPTPIPAIEDSDPVEDSVVAPSSFGGPSIRPSTAPSAFHPSDATSVFPPADPINYPPAAASEYKSGPSCAEQSMWVNHVWTGQVSFTKTQKQYMPYIIRSLGEAHKKGLIDPSV